MSRKVPQKATSLKRWIKTEIVWNRKLDSRELSKIVERRRPISETNCQPSSPNGPRVSTAIRRCVAEIVSQLACLHAAAALAAPAEAVESIWTYETVNVSTIIASHVRQRPPCHGTNVRPSGCFSSPRTRPAGFLVAGMSARLSACQIISLSCWCLVDLQVLHLQERPCSSCASTLAPHGQIWGSHRLRHSLRLTAIRIVSSLKRSPQPILARRITNRYYVVILWPWV